VILPLGSHLWTYDLIPQLESFLHLFAVLRRGKAITSWSEVVGDRTIRGEKVLRSACALYHLRRVELE